MSENIDPISARVWVQILAAGTGSRMKPLAFDCHKALLPINDGDGTLVVLLKQLERFESIAGVTIVTGYKQTEISETAQRHLPEVHLVQNEQFGQTTLLESLKLGLISTPGVFDTLVLFADTVYADSALALMLRAPACCASVAVVNADVAVKPEIPVCITGDRVAGFMNNDDQRWQMALMVRWPARLIQYLRTEDFFGLSAQWQVLAKLLQNGEHINAIKVNGLIADIDLPEDYVYLQRVFATVSTYDVS